MKAHGKEDPISWFQLTILGTLLLFCISSQIFFVIKLLKMKWKDLRPIHVHQVNYFTGLACINISGIHLVVSRAFDEPSSFCPSHLLSYLFLISNKYDIIILQLDRLLAIRKPYYYEEFVDVKVAMKVVFMSKVFSISIAVISSMIDPIFLYCPSCGMCNFVKSVYLYSVSYPAIAAFILTILVSIYVSIMVNKLNSIQPLVSLPVTSHCLNVLPVVQTTVNSKNS